MSQFPPITSFFQATTPKKPNTGGVVTTLDLSRSNETTTTNNIESTILDSSSSLRPLDSYEKTPIAHLSPGPCKAHIAGRVVNFFDAATPSKMPSAATGYLKMIVKDDTGVLSVKVWQAEANYTVCLGSLVSIWTTHVSTAAKVAGSQNMPDPALLTDIFPERDSACGFEIHDSTLCAQTEQGPTVQKDSTAPSVPIRDLATLEQFISGGASEIPTAKVLACVRSISNIRTVTTKTGTTVKQSQITIFDTTRQTILTVWSKMAISASSWKPLCTILLLSNISCTKRGYLSLKTNSQVDVDPDIAEARELRRFVDRETWKGRLNPPFPEDLFDLENFKSVRRKILFKLADLESFIKAGPSETYLGYLSVLITETNITSLYLKKQLLCGECCNTSHRANSVQTTYPCPQCKRPNIPLRLNPRLIGPLVDETGALASGSLIWSDAAWEQLLGRSTEDLLALPKDAMKYLEQRVCWMRVSLLFGWAGGEKGEERTGGRLCVVGIEE